MDLHKALHTARHGHVIYEVHTGPHVPTVMVKFTKYELYIAHVSHPVCTCTFDANSFVVWQ